MRRWAGEQARLLTELGRQRARLQPEAGAAELERLHELKRALLAKQGSVDELEQRQLQLAETETSLEVRAELDQLGGQLGDVLDARAAAQASVEEYTAALQAFREWHQRTADQLQAVDARPSEGRLSAS